MSPDEARRQALLKLGGVAQVREATRDARGVRWLEDLAGDVVRLFLRDGTRRTALGRAARVDPMPALRVE